MLDKGGLLNAANLVTLWRQTLYGKQCNYGIGQGWPTSRSPSRSRSTGRSPIVSWFCIELTRYLKRTLFNQYSRKYTKIIHRWVGHVYSLVPFAMADHRLARQMPQRSCNVFLLLRDSHDVGVTDILPAVHHLRMRWYTICTCDTQLRHFALVALLPTGRSRVMKKFSSRSQSKTSWPPLV